jgi:hypothetical protein
MVAAPGGILPEFGGDRRCASNPTAAFGVAATLEAPNRVLTKFIEAVEVLAVSCKGECPGCSPKSLDIV